MDKLKKYGKKKICAFLMAVIAVTGIAAASVMAAEDPNGAYSHTDTDWYKYTAAITTTSSESGVISGNYQGMYYGASTCALSSTDFKFNAYCTYKTGLWLTYQDFGLAPVNTTTRRRVSEYADLSGTYKWKLKLKTTTGRACYGCGWICDYQRYS